MPQTRRISDSEWLVMKVLWEESPLTTTDVVDALEPTTKWKLKTVLTLLNRLVKKGAVGYEKKGRAYHYYPLVGEKECALVEHRSFLQRVYGGSMAPMLAHFIEDRKLSAAEIEELKQILDKKGPKR